MLTRRHGVVLYLQAPRRSSRAKQVRAKCKITASCLLSGGRLLGVVRVTTSEELLVKAK